MPRFTTTEQVFLPGHLSRLALGPGQNVPFVPGPTASRASGGTGAFCPGWRHQPRQKRGILSRLVAPTGTKTARTFCPGWRHQPGQKRGLLSRLVAPTGTKDPCPSPPPLARLAIGPGTKATYCPGPKDCRDKWPNKDMFCSSVTCSKPVASRHASGG